MNHERGRSHTHPQIMPAGPIACDSTILACPAERVGDRIGGMENKPAVPKTELLQEECWRLLREASVGRLAVWHGDGPDIFPINYATDHGTVIFRTCLLYTSDAADDLLCVDLGG